ncbi:MAG: hypothetical protein V7607_3032 [Solirubrobacteraceae bacterium]
MAHDRHWDRSCICRRAAAMARLRRSIHCASATAGVAAAPICVTRCGCRNAGISRFAPAFRPMEHWRGQPVSAKRRSSIPTLTPTRSALYSAAGLWGGLVRAGARPRAPSSRSHRDAASGAGGRRLLASGADAGHRRRRDSGDRAPGRQQTKGRAARMGQRPLRVHAPRARDRLRGGGSTANARR